MSKNETEIKKTSHGATWIILGAALGVAAVTLFTKRRHNERFDVTTVIDACDRAAAKLDEILTGEQMAQAG